MSTLPKRSLLAELKRRRVFPVGGAYLVIGWLITEIAGFLLDKTGAPGWSTRLLAIVFVVGFPVSVALAWIFQRRPGGEWRLDSSRGQGRAAAATLALGLTATLLLAWMILPRIEDEPPGYQPLPNSLAILPLEISDAIPGSQTVGTKLYDALTEGLAQARGLTQVQLKLKNLPDDPYAFGRRVRVNALLAGRVQRRANELSVEMSLLDIGHATPRWSRTFDWDSTRIMETGSAIANDVLESMDLQGITTEQFAGTRNREAYDAWLVGLSHWSSWTTKGLEEAMASMKQAAELDPGFARAWFSLANLSWMYAGMKGAPADQREAMVAQSRHALDMALSLDDRSARAVSMLGRFSDNRDLRVQLFRRALELDPTHALSYFRLGWMEFEDGNLEEAARLMRQALDYSPLDANYRMDLANVLRSMGLDAEAKREMETAIEYQPDMPQLPNRMGVWAFEYGHYDEAIVRFHEAHVLDPHAGWIAGWIASTWADLGAEEEAQEWIRVGEQLMPSGICAWLAAIYWQMGEVELARQNALATRQIFPDNPLLADLFSRLDVDEGRPDRALARWEEFEPRLSADDDGFCHKGYAYALIADGQSERARQFLLPCLQARDERKQGAMAYDTEQMYAHALLGNRKETLDFLEKLVLGEGWRRKPDIRVRHEFDFLEGDPRFERLMAIIDEDLALQLERVREMDRNGELDPISVSP